MLLFVSPTRGHDERYCVSIRLEGILTCVYTKMIKEFLSGLVSAVNMLLSCSLQSLLLTQLLVQRSQLLPKVP